MTAEEIASARKGRPKINREVEAMQERLARINAGLLACYETIEIGNRKKAECEAALLRAREGK